MLFGEALSSLLLFRVMITEQWAGMEEKQALLMGYDDQLVGKRNRTHISAARASLLHSTLLHDDRAGER